MNPTLVEVFLSNFHEFQDAQDIESQYLLWDLNAAIYSAPLTSDERRVIQRLYIDPPQPPSRDKPDKNGLTAGRPSGGTTQAAIGAAMGIEKSTFSNIKKMAIEKISDFLGAEYGNDD